MLFQLFGILLLWSCTPVRVVSTDTSPDMDFSSYETFGFVEADPEMAMTPNLDYLKDAIAGQLNRRGLTQSENPDILINIATDVESKVQTRETDIRDAPRYMGTRNYSWQSEEIVVNEYEEGTVKIDVVDAGSNQMVWQGIAAGTLTTNREKMQNRIDKAMEALFNEFPLRITE